jgi:hypothetical protein
MVVNGKAMEATKVWSLRSNVEKLNFKTFRVMLQEVKFMPDLWVNLFSINKALKSGFKIWNEGIIINLSKGSTTLSFERILKTIIDDFISYCWSYFLNKKRSLKEVTNLILDLKDQDIYHARTREKINHWKMNAKAKDYGLSLNIQDKEFHREMGS